MTPAFRLAVLVNAAYVLAEAGARFLTGSLALLADAAHNLADVAGLLLAWGAAVLAQRAASARFTWGYGRTTFLAALGIDRAEVAAFLARLPGGEAIHDLHLWPLSTTRAALSVHLSMPGGHPGDARLAAFADELQHRFKLAHATLQVETGAGPGCATGSDCAPAPTSE